MHLYALLLLLSYYYVFPFPSWLGLYRITFSRPTGGWRVTARSVRDIWSITAVVVIAPSRLLFDDRPEARRSRPAKSPIRTVVTGDFRKRVDIFNQFNSKCVKIDLQRNQQQKIDILNEKYNKIPTEIKSNSYRFSFLIIIDNQNQSQSNSYLKRFIVFKKRVTKNLKYR